MRPRINFLEIGSRYKNWTVLGKEKKINSHWYMLCRCDCSQKRFIRITYLVNNKLFVSCHGCQDRYIKHGHVRNYKESSEYTSWRDMKNRCYYESMTNYNNYGGRGIHVCERWRISFENFLLDMGRKPTQFHTIDRKDGNGNYESKNCRWATKKEQANNRR